MESSDNTKCRSRELEPGVQEQYSRLYGDAFDDRVAEVVEEILAQRGRPYRFGLRLMVVATVVLTLVSAVSILATGNLLLVAASWLGGALFNYSLAKAATLLNRLVQ